MKEVYFATLLILLLVLFVGGFLRPKYWTQCAWCKIWINEFGGTQSHTPQNVPSLISHGICPDCADRLKTQINELNKNNEQ